MDAKAGAVLATVIVVLIGLLSLAIYLQVTNNESKIELESKDDSSNLKEDLERERTNERVEIINKQLGPRGVIESADVHIRMHTENLLHEKKKLEEKHTHEIRCMDAQNSINFQYFYI